MANPYTFPFTTCETPASHGIAQWYSFTVNVMIVAGLIYMMRLSSTTPTQVLLISLIVFETWHAFSHAYHIQGHIQAFVIHALAYIIAAALVFVIHSKRGTLLPWLILLAIFIDVIALTCLSQKEWSVITGSLVVAAVLIPFSLHLPLWIPIAFFCYFLVGIIAFLLEKRYCHTWMQAYAFPYHVIVEIIVGMFLWTFAYVVTIKG